MITSSFDVPSSFLGTGHGSDENSLISFDRRQRKRGLVLIFWQVLLQ